MKKKNHKKHPFLRSIRIPILLGMIMVLTHLIKETIAPDLYQWGIYPRDWSGLKGVFFFHFIHGDWKHLGNNLISFLPLSAILFVFYRRNRFQVYTSALLMSGFLTWIGGRSSYHIGASAWIYALASYLFFNSLRDANPKSKGITFTIVLFYGSMVWGIFPQPEYLNISWEGHLMGFITGIFLSYAFPSRFPKRKKYSWEKEKDLLDELKEPVIYEEIHAKKTEDDSLFQWHSNHSFEQ
ncbi:MAG: rhomboid family intramembrane serine protease [Flavobacteriales bacterium]|jgi:membrane associated rhomboid family serine protease|nr:rhomboid family intramembrane serine protease [Flavobacteriales bacterium]